jgi:fluoride exporter
MTAIPGPPSASRRLQVLGGGAVGTALRLAFVTPLVVVADGGWPLATFLANVVGAFALGVLVAAGATRPGLRHRLPFIGTGLLGSLTTFSALAVGTVLLAQAGRPAAAAGYLVASTLAGLLAAAAGIGIGHTVRRPGPADPSGRVGA